VVNVRYGVGLRDVEYGLAEVPCFLGECSGWCMTGWITRAPR